MSKALLKNYRQSPRKVRLVADMIRGKSVEESLHILSFVDKNAASAVKGVLASALANAVDRGEDTSNLIVSSIRVDEGFTLYRMMPRAQGRAFRIRKRTSHIAIELAPKTEPAKKVKDTVNK